MAGESPGRAEQQESSGEATGRKADDREVSEVAEASAELPTAPGEADAGIEGEPGAGSGGDSDTDSVTDSAADSGEGVSRGDSRRAEGSGSEAAEPARTIDDSAPARTPDAPDDVREADTRTSPVTAAEDPEGAEDGEGDGTATAPRDVDGTPEPEAPEAPEDAGSSEGSEQSERPAEAPGKPAGSKAPESRAATGGRGEADGSSPPAGAKAPTGSKEPGKPEGSGEPEGLRRRPSWAADGPEGPGGSAGAKGAREPVPAAHTPSGATAAGTRTAEAARKAPEQVSAKVPVEAPEEASGETPEKTAEKTPAGAAIGRRSTFVPLVPQDPDRTTAPPKWSTSPPTAAPAPAAEPGTEQALSPKRERTKQLPVPPVPGEPLKLLAELTNTPPPAETALRVLVRRFKIWTPLVALLALVFCAVQALRPLPEPELKASGHTGYTFGGGKLSMPWPGQGQSVAEVEGLGGLGGEGARTPVPIASVTKVMTAYVILKDHPLSGKANGPTITVDAAAAQESGSEDESTAKVRKGQRFTERQMLQLLLIPSGNNIARLLARWDAGSESVFVKKMMKTAAELGMKNTTYTGASGFEPTTKSTAADQLKLARQVMKNDVFRSVVGITNIDIPGVGRIFNTNNLLVNYGVLGVKTGSSTPAGGALMWAAKRTVEGKEQLILGVVLQQRGGVTVNDSLQLALNNSMKLIKAVQDGLTSATVVKKGEVVGYVDDGLGGKTPVVATKDLTAVGWPGLTRELTLDTPADGIPHSAKAGTKVGTLSYGSGSAATQVPVALRSDLVQPGFGAKLTRLG